MQYDDVATIPRWPMGNRFSAISERHVIQLTLNLEGVRHLELLKFGGPILIGHATLHLILFAATNLQVELLNRAPILFRRQFGSSVRRSYPRHGSIEYVTSY